MFLSIDDSPMRPMSPQGATADTSTGSSTPAGSYEPRNALDGDLSSFWAGDHDHGLGCTCALAEKKG